jgi:hypothetical protein
VATEHNQPITQKLIYRREIMHDTYKFAAPGVVAEIVPTDANHIFFDANGGNRADPLYIEIRGITYGVSGHFNKWKDGSWNLGNEADSEGVRLYHLYMSRPATYSGKAKVSRPARQQALEIMTAIVREWVTTAPDALAHAERKATEAKLAKARAKISELEADLKAWTADAEALEAQLR